MKNIGIQWVRTANTDTFTSNIGIRLRRIINRPLRAILRLATKRKIVIEEYPVLEKGTPYIFASTHTFDEDTIAGLGCIDRPVYVLIGTTNQIEHNPQMYAAWLNGMIYVNRLSAESRKQSTDKMERILRSGSSILMFPEGGWNNTENLLINPIFAGPYILANRTGAKIVPVCSFCEHDADTIYFSAGQPIDATAREKDDVLCELRDSMATLMYTAIERHSTPLKREELVGDYRMAFMAARCREYQRVKWSRDTWEEELTIYRDKRYPTPEQVRATLKDVQPTKNNAAIMAPIFAQIEDDKKYDFKEYMHEHWDKI